MLSEASPSPWQLLVYRPSLTTVSSPREPAQFIRLWPNFPGTSVCLDQHRTDSLLFWLQHDRTKQSSYSRVPVLLLPIGQYCFSHILSHIFSHNRCGGKGRYLRLTFQPICHSSASMVRYPSSHNNPQPFEKNRDCRPSRSDEVCVSGVIRKASTRHRIPEARSRSSTQCTASISRLLLLFAQTPGWISAELQCKLFPDLPRCHWFAVVTCTQNADIVVTWLRVGHCSW